MLKNVIILVLTLTLSKVIADEVGSVTGFKIPRYVSLKYDESNLRVGPSTNYPKKLTYNKSNIPVEIVDEFENWRKIIDFENNTGWMKQHLLKGNRYALIKTPYSEGAQIFVKPEGKLIGKIGNRNIVKLNMCLQKWCKITHNNNKGWVNKINLWGAYKEEQFNVPFYQPLINLIWKLNL